MGGTKDNEGMKSLRAGSALFVILLCALATMLWGPGYATGTKVCKKAAKPELVGVPESELLSHMYTKGEHLNIENSNRRINSTGPWFLGTCTATKGSGAWMREWIELQIAVGVDHVWVADDNPRSSHDTTTSILKHYEKLGYVTIIPPPPGMGFPGCEQLGGIEGRHQCAPVKHCFIHASPHVKWLLFADTDEFIFPHNGCSVAEHIRNHCNPDATHIYVKWERFGTSDIEQHPNGMMLENFLSSGGMCEKHFNGLCGRMPFSICPECRHSKVIYNTECAKVEHAGWIHWPVNTTDWKAAEIYEYQTRTWVKSEGAESHWKSEACVYYGLRDDSARCNAWAIAGRGSKNGQKIRYTPDCCTAGIGYNHYGTKSRQYYERKQRNRRTFKRGYRTSLDRIDSNNVLSFSVLKFLRAVRKRFAGMGVPVSDNVDFVELPGGKSCFTEKNWKYTPTEDTATVQTNARTMEECCQVCFEMEMCKAFTLSSGVCSLFIGSKTIPGTVLRDNPYQLHANRSWVLRDVSGIPLREGECT